MHQVQDAFFSGLMNKVELVTTKHLAGQHTPSF